MKNLKYAKNQDRPHDNVMLYLLLTKLRVKILYFRFCGFNIIINNTSYYVTFINRFTD